MPVLLVPVQKAPLLVPIKVQEVAFAIRTEVCDTLLPSRNTIEEGIPLIICISDGVRVPSKSLVGDITSVAVLVVVGPKLPVAVTPAIDRPPKASVIDPAVLPVIVHESKYRLVLAIVAG
jgi:hypothetical protein